MYLSKTQHLIVYNIGFVPNNSLFIT